jgi:diacylglycerol kinase (ATP)
MRAVALLGPNADADDVAAFATAARIPIPTHNAIDLSAPPDVALIFGGDGTVHRHLAALVQTQIPVLIVPAGSGNDFARALGLKTRERAMAAWRRFCDTGKNVRAIDVGEITAIDHRPSTIDLFCCVAGAGMDADINRRANHLPRWLRANGGYALSVVAGALNFRPQRITVEFEDEKGAAGTISEPALMCAFANANAYGHGMRIAPRAQVDDGLLDLVFVRKAGAARLLTLFPTVYFGAHMGIREVEYRRVRRLSISSETPLDIYADGEFICQTPAEVRVRPKALNVIYNL